VLSPRHLGNGGWGGHVHSTSHFSVSVYDHFTANVHQHFSSAQSFPVHNCASLPLHTQPMNTVPKKPEPVASSKPPPQMPTTTGSKRIEQDRDKVVADLGRLFRDPAHPDFKIVCIGSGANGMVFRVSPSRVVKATLSTRAAAKLPFYHTLQNLLCTQINSKDTRRAYRHFYVSSRFTYSDTIPDENGKPAYVYEEMVHMPMDLKHYANENRDWGLQELVDILCQIMHALRLFHRAGYIVTDLKLDNVMIDPETGRVRLIDFLDSYDVVAHVATNNSNDNKNDNKNAGKHDGQGAVDVDADGAVSTNDSHSTSTSSDEPLGQHHSSRRSKRVLSRVSSSTHSLNFTHTFHNRNNPVTHKEDVWRLGILVLGMLVPYAERVWKQSHPNNTDRDKQAFSTEFLSTMRHDIKNAKPLVQYSYKGMISHQLDRIRKVVLESCESGSEERTLWKALFVKLVCMLQDDVDKRPSIRKLLRSRLFCTQCMVPRVDYSADFGASGPSKVQCMADGAQERSLQQDNRSTKSAQEEGREEENEVATKARRTDSTADTDASTGTAHQHLPRRSTSRRKSTVHVTEWMPNRRYSLRQVPRTRASSRKRSRTVSGFRKQSKYTSRSAEHRHHARE